MDHWNLIAAWAGICLGMLSGAVKGVCFHREDWLGGYGSWTRRMLRLGHISFFGIAFLNLAFVLTIDRLGDVPAGATLAASLGLLTGAVGMPVVCFFAAWRKGLRLLFPLPVLCLLTAGGVVLWVSIDTL